MVDYTNWGPSEPNGQYGNEHCVETIANIVDNFNPKRHKWNDIPCDLARPAAVCAYYCKYGYHKTRKKIIYVHFRCQWEISPDEMAKW